jgi:hypothetical protein
MKSAERLRIRGRGEDTSTEALLAGTASSAVEVAPFQTKRRLGNSSVAAAKGARKWFGER